MMLIKILLVVLLLCVGLFSAQPSAPEFNLFCRIIKKANDMMYGPNYVYDEVKDREVVKEMEVLYNATTENMDEFGKMLWKMRDFLGEHPPPIDTKNRKHANREIKKLIAMVKKKIQETQKLVDNVNKKMEEAKLPVVQGIYGDEVKEVPKEEGKLKDFLRSTNTIFNSETSVSESCGSNDKTGKTLINDLFCVCIGDGSCSQSAPPCHPDLKPATKADCTKNDCCCKENCCTKDKHGCCENTDCCNCRWTKMNYKDEADRVLNLTESFEKIEEVCLNLLKDADQSKDMPALLEEYVDMIGNGGNKTGNIFGHSWRSKEKGDIKACTGAGTYAQGTDYEKYNELICVDYTKNHKGVKNYYIPWHEKFKKYSTIMKDAKKVEDEILQNHVEILLLKSRAWTAYSREKDDQTDNLDGMNVSHFFNGAHSTNIIPLPFLFLIL
ncbi:Variant surface glycoprotein [Trypanosoma congolense IL3000]|uniref:Variant surface glycoprotein n=1 Tax=Trypanosoma congolense (strain IL3000) TaxID=1068625 RepID=F9W4A0_TRYCI|nr:Variant surface glycoprotein [Trypanosoma congolense IL3000]